MLQRQDWAGLAPSRPVNMHFASSKEKDRIGKRRKTGRRPSTRRKNNEESARQTVHDTASQNPGPYVGGALQRDVEDITVQIGTDALTTQPSMQRFDQAHPQTAAAPRAPSSDSMLFDHEHLYTALEEPMQSTRHVSPSSVVRMESSTHVHTVPRLEPFSQRPDFTQQRKGCQQSHASYTPKAKEANRNQLIQRAPPDVSTFHITHRIGGVERPMCFVFDRSSDISSVGGATDSLHVADAGLPAFGHAKSALGNNKHGSSDVGSACPPAIADDGLWKSFLVIPDDSSSRPTTAGMSRSGLLHSFQLSPEKRASEAGPGVGSRQGTLGDQTCMHSSSSLSASLPSLTPEQDRDQGMRRGQSGDGNRIENPEKLWQWFVLGGGHGVDSDTMHEGGTGEGKNSNLGSPRFFPSSLAVASCSISDHEQGAANRTPLSTSSGTGSMLLITSPEPREGYAQEIKGYEEIAGGPLAAEHSVNEEHASIINNVSHVTDATLSRQRSLIGPALATRSDLGPNSHESILDMACSWSEGIDLVDPDRLW